jgi:hypothetical protein
MIALGFADCSVGLRHALGFADELRRRCLVNRETAKSVAKSLGLDQEQTHGVVRLLRNVGQVSPERLAVVAMRDWGLTDEDIAEIFGRSERWARVVRSQQDEIRADEPIPEHLEFLDAGLQQGDPCPEEIRRRAAELRVHPLGNRNDRPGGPALRCYQWSRHAFVSVSPD